MAKFYLFLFFIILSSNLLAQTDSTGWIDKGDYIEMKKTIAPIIFIKYANDGKSLFTFSADSIFRKWDISTGKIVKENKTKYGSAKYFDLSPDEQKYIATYEHGALLNSLVNDSVPYHFSESKYPIPCKRNNFFEHESYFSFNPFSNEFVHQPLYEIYCYGYNDKLESVSMEGWFEVLSFDTPLLHMTYQKGSAKAFLQYSPDGKYIAYNSYSSKSYKQFDLHLEIADRSFSTKAVINGFYQKYQYVDRPDLIWILFSHNSKFLAYSYDNYLKINSVPDGKEICNLNNNNMKISNNDAFIFSKDSKKIITGFYDETYNKSAIKVWSIPSGDLLNTINFSNKIDNWRFAYNKDLNFFASGSSDGKIRIFKNSITDDLEALFTTDTNSITSGESIRFEDNSTGKPKYWLWDFGDGKTSKLQNPVHAYDNAGVYSVKLIVGNSLKYDTLIKKNFIKVLKPEPSDVTESILSNIQYNFEFYPNPFNEKITFKFNLPVRKYVNFRIYNINGVLVDELANEIKSAGEYKIDFKTVENSHGIYYYKLQIGESNLTGIIISVN